MYNITNKNLLEKSSDFSVSEDEQIKADRDGSVIEEKSTELGSRLNVENITISPQVISYDCFPAQGVLARNLPRLANDLQLELGCESLTIHAPSPGTKFVKIEVNNPSRRLVRLGDIL
jgi:S-DNA-T family DNA segregation ATPase FtsK/SpoIIIE